MPPRKPTVKPEIKTTQCPACKGNRYVLSHHAPPDNDMLKMVMRHVSIGHKTWLILCDWCNGRGYLEENK